MTEDSDYTFQYRAFSEALYEALKPDPFYVTLESRTGSPEGRRGAMLKYLDYSMVEAAKYGELFIPTDHGYGVSIWSKPLAPDVAQQKKEEKRRFLLDHLGEDAEQTYQDIVVFMSEKSATLVDDRFWYLSIVGILPKFQGRGLGVGLLKVVLNKADHLGIPTYLETFTPRNETFYQRLGYRVAGAFDEPVTGAKYSLMIREPSSR